MRNPSVTVGEDWISETMVMVFSNDDHFSNLGIYPLASSGYNNLGVSRWSFCWPMYLKIRYMVREGNDTPTEISLGCMTDP